jgi:poly-gamma-glutamate synthesis protein (capsule biosynthesis protein)
MTVLLACGDVGVKRSDCDSMFDGCRSVFSGCDVIFAQLETTVSERGARVPSAKLAMRAPQAMLAAARRAGINVMSFAGNHCLDFGYEAFEDTLTHAKASDVALCGAGANLSQALKPAIIEAGGARIAVIAASSILPEGYAAAHDRAGCAPLRAHTHYEQIEPDQPGTPSRVRTFANRADLEAVVAAVRSARLGSDLVLVSLHWGIHMVPVVLADYQRQVGRALIEAGADAILGHHPHILKGIEIYRGRPIFYSLGNFAIEQPHVWDPKIVHSESFRNLQNLNPTWSLEETYVLPAATRMTGIAKIVASGGGIDARFLPAFIGDDSVPRMLEIHDPRFGQVQSFLEQSCRDADCGTRIELQDEELRILADTRSMRGQ